MELAAWFELSSSRNRSALEDILWITSGVEVYENAEEHSFAELWF